jgi:ubiquinone/menaquinone biosynthesis C-methylase UbiE
MELDEYRKLAEFEDRMWYMRALHRHAQRSLALGGLGRDAAADMLDAGCGTGGLILRLREFAPEWRWTGIDFSSVACALARERLGPTTRMHEASITELPFADGSFDHLVSVDVICQVEYRDEAARAVREFFRVLRPGGVVVINVPAYRWMWSYHDDTCQTRHRYERHEVVELLKDAGFEPMASTHWNCLPFPFLLAKRKLFPSPLGASDVQIFPPAIEWAFDVVMALERLWLSAGLRLPWGSSVLAVARKPGSRSSDGRAGL